MTLLQVQQLRKVFGKNEAVKEITFSIQKGKCVTLLGPNGAGKSTTLSMLAGLLEPTSGNIHFTNMNGKDIRQYIGYLPQYPAFYNWMTGWEFLHYVGRLAYMTKADLHARTDELLQLVGLTDAKNRKIGGYSGGMKQRLGIAQALIHRPQLLILDEPVSSLDPIGRREILEMIKKIKQETTILFSTHVLHDAEEISEDVMIMNKGELVLQGELKDLLKKSLKQFILIEADSSLEPWVTTIKSLEHVDNVAHDLEQMKIYVRDLELAKQEVLHEIVKHKIPIQRFEISTSTLEDLFLQVVTT